MLNGCATCGGMAWWSKKEGSPKVDEGRIERMLAAVTDLQAQVASLDATVKAQGRDLDDLDDSLRRFKGRRSKTTALDDTPDPEPVNGARRPPSPTPLPTIGQLRLAGKLPR